MSKEQIIKVYDPIFRQTFLLYFNYEFNVFYREVLAKSSVYRVRDNSMPGEWWTSPFIDNEWCASRGEAYVATVAKLKEVAG